MKNFNFIPIVGVLCLLIVLSVFQIGGCNENNTDKDKFPQPEVRKSQNGILRTNIEVALATNQVQDPSTGEIKTINTPTYEGGLTGPTLRVKPGDTMLIDMINNLPPNPPQILRRTVWELFLMTPLPRIYILTGLPLTPVAFPITCLERWSREVR